MAVTNNANTINASNSVLFVASLSGIGSDLDQVALAITVDATGSQYGLHFVANSNALLVSCEATIASVSSVGLDKACLLASSDGSIVQINSINGAPNTCYITLDAQSYVSNSINCDATVLVTGLSGLGITSNSISCGAVAAFVSMAANLIQGSSQTIASDADEDFPTITGSNYIIVNLRTKSHTIYKDGNNIAAMKTGLLNFGSVMDKNVSDVYLWSRSSEDLEFHTKNNEITNREYLAKYGETGQENLYNKKIMLAKGLKGTNWQFSIVSNGDDFAEVRSIDLIVNELKRRV